MKQKVHHYDPCTLIYSHSSEITLSAGYKKPLVPQCTTNKELLTYNEDYQDLKFNKEIGSWIVVDKKKEVTAYHKTDRKSKLFEDKSLVPEDYTLEIPSSDFDEYVGESWVTNIQLKFSTEEHEWVCSELNWYDTKIVYANRGDFSRSGGYTKEQLDSYAIALCDYTSKDSEGNITVNSEVRPSI